MKPGHVASWGAVAMLLLLLPPSPAIAQETGLGASAPAAGQFRPSMVFTFLFLAMGPFALIPGFAALTAGRDRNFKFGLALMGVGVAAIAIVVAGTIGVGMLDSWGVSRPALVLTTGLLLLLIALRTIFEVYKPRAPLSHGEGAAAAAEPLPTRATLAFSPLAFPMILPPFGIGVIVVLLTLARERDAMAVLAGLIALVLALDFLAMIFADVIMRTPYIKNALLILGSIVGVLQAALAVEAIADSIRDLNIT